MVKWQNRELISAHLGELSLVAAVDGRRCRGSWRRFETPASRLKDELDLDALWLREKLRCAVDAEDDAG